MKLATFIRSLCLSITLVLPLAGGCGGQAEPESIPDQTPIQVNEPVDAEPASQEVVLPPQSFELNVDSLLALRLPAEQAGDGWVRLFDGQSLFGWDMAGLANWSVEDGTLVVSSGEKSLLCTSLPWSDYEFQVEYKADANTNSGIFFHTPLMPQDPATECYELNIAPPDNPFPTGSLVGREKVEPADLGEIDANEWHTYLVSVDGDQVSVMLDGKTLYTYTDPSPLGQGRIGLQHNSGKVAFRNVMLRPLNLGSLLPEQASEDGEIEGWKKYPDMQGSFTINDEGHLRVEGGKGQLETEEEYGNFVLIARAKTNSDNQNSGLFFRCIPGEEMNGYECQINNDAKDGNPMFPADCGTGGFFRRQDARVIAAENNEWFDLVLAVNGSSMAAWVNGIQVSQWQDTREPDPNPRKGLRVEPGTIMIQAHDETTDVTFEKLGISKSS